MKRAQNSDFWTQVKKWNPTSRTEIRQKSLKYLFLETPCIWWLTYKRYLAQMKIVYKMYFDNAWHILFQRNHLIAGNLWNVKRERSLNQRMSRENPRSQCIMKRPIVPFIIIIIVIFSFNIIRIFIVHRSFYWAIFCVQAPILLVVTLMCIYIFGKSGGLPYLTRNYQTIPLSSTVCSLSILWANLKLVFLSFPKLTINCQLSMMASSQWQWLSQRFLINRSR